MDRRSFLKAMAAGAITFSLTPSGVLAKLPDGTVEFVGVLVDTTRCIGCRRCELRCAQVNGLPLPNPDDKKVFEKERWVSSEHWTIVNRYKTERGTFYIKRQCMHCCQPACAAACPVKAMEKKKEGPVVWNPNCIGCKTCAFSCPWGVPELEPKPFPRIGKCIFCWPRLQKGLLPACVETCPMEAIIFGTRRQLLEEARTRIYKNPDKYYHYIYGEREVGGTSWMYLTPVHPEKMGLRMDVGKKALPENTTGFLFAVPYVLVLWPAFLLGAHKATERRKKVEEKNKESAEG